MSEAKKAKTKKPSKKKPEAAPVIVPPAEPRGKDRRKHERAECDGFAEVVIDNASLMFRGRIKDLSQTGCYIETRARLRLDVGCAAELCFTINDRSFKAVAEVKVIRAGVGVGFEILFLAAESRAPSDLMALIQKLESRIPTPAV
ncbi:hypothetical protein ACPOL_2116 [Acidisarcina polymorpha]|uniref:PilZ domain-containing protein n=1 Tax=Acidisarcina polymorpha TaxID=2211140 RepID=A0A2Z5FXH8_9BACT|nr:PilZ domain-containing protein [Acidisarcina polymorpha]AXC11440.1 hypothetical protein ACPOL_2116 [Acidisarcina polymorpha]